MRSIRPTTRGQIRSNLLQPISNVEMVQSTVEKLQRGFWLVVRHFMTGFIDAQETEVAVLTHFAVFDAVYGERFVACCGELGAVGVV